MFIAKFNQVQSDSEKFTADKNSAMPFIGEVLAGKATGTLINGTMFIRNGYSPNKLYACENVVEDYENPVTGAVEPQVRVQIISEISVLEYVSLKPTLGAPKLEIAEKVVAPAAAGAPAFQA